VALFFCGSLPLLGGSIFGHIRLSSPNDCAGLRVELRAREPNGDVSLPVDNQCRYGKSDIAPGVYELTVKAAGYYDYVSNTLEMTEKGQLLLDPVLRSSSNMRELAAFLGSNPGIVISLSALMLGIFGLRYFKRPTFEVRAVGLEPYCHTAVVFFRNRNPDYRTSPAEAGGDIENIVPFSIHFCRVWVVNSGTDDAYHVEAFAMRMFKEEPEPDEKAPRGDNDQGCKQRKFKPYEGFRPMNLRWANSWQISRDPATVEPAALIKHRISTQTGRFLDLGFLVNPQEVDEFVRMARLPSTKSNQKERESSGNVRLFLTLDAIGDDSGVALSKGNYLFEILIDCDAIRAERFYLYMEIDNWKSVKIKLAGSDELLAIGAKQHARTFPMWIVRCLRRGNRGLFVPVCNSVPDSRKEGASAKNASLPGS